MMTAKEYLQQAYIFDCRARLAEEKLAAMRSSLYGRGITYETDGAQHSRDGNSIERAIHRVMDYEKRLDEEIDSLVDKRLEIEHVIGRIPDEALREVLTRRYLLFEKWEDIADKMGYCERDIYRKHTKALKCLENDVGELAG